MFVAAQVYVADVVTLPVLVTSSLIFQLMLALPILALGLQAARPVNAASFLRDPYRGDDFERTSSQGMRSDYGRYDGQGHRKPGGFGDLMDDRYNPATSSAAYARPGSRSQRV